MRRSRRSPATPSKEMSTTRPAGGGATARRGPAAGEHRRRTRNEAARTKARAVLRRLPDGFATRGDRSIGTRLGRAAVGSAYGAAGSVIVLLLWVYYVSMIVLFGAEFTRAYSRRLEKHALPPEKGAKKQPKGADVPT